MMVKPSVNELLEIEGIDNRYTLCVMTSKRARQISKGDKKMTKSEEKSTVTIAANEIAEGKVVKC